MKRITAVLLACILAVCICSCGASSSAAGSEGSGETAEGEGFTGLSFETSYDPVSGVETVDITDDIKRTVTIPAEVTRVAPSGQVAQMMLMTLAPELMVGLAASPSSSQRPYFPEYTWYLPTFGQLYGSKSTLNLEALLAEEPQVLIDVGDRKATIFNDMNMITRQTGIPCVYYEATLPCMAHAYREVGRILGCEDKAEALACFVEETLAMAEEKSALIPEDEKLTVYYGTGASGLAANAQGSSQAQVIDIIGAKNAIIPDTITDTGGGTQVNMEEVYNADPDIFVFAQGGPYDILTDSEWSELTAVKNGMYYEIPYKPYNWLSAPPSINMVLGVWWLGQLVYPDIYNDYDIIEKAQEYYSLFWNYELTREEAREMLERSTEKIR